MQVRLRLTKMNNLIDKILLASLVLMLPIGFFLAQWLFSESEETEMAGIDIAALEQMIQQSLSASQAEPAPTPRPINIGAVSYASDSGYITVAGTAPYPQATVLVSATVLPLEPETPQQTGDSSPASVQGQRVEVFSIQPESDGNFTYSYLIPRSARTNLIELRFDQDTSTKTIRYDPVTQKQIF